MRVSQTGKGPAKKDAVLSWRRQSEEQIWYRVGDGFHTPRLAACTPLPQSPTIKAIELIMWHVVCTWGSLMEVKTYQLLCEATLKHLDWISRRGCWHTTLDKSHTGTYLYSSDCPCFSWCSSVFLVTARQDCEHPFWMYSLRAQQCTQAAPIRFIKKERKTSNDSGAQLGQTRAFACPFASFCHHLEGKNRGWECTRREKHHKSLTVSAGGWISKPCSFSYLRLHPTCLSPSCRNNRPLER